MDSKIFFYLLILLCNQYTNAKLSGYYWRDYAGVTPNDALAAGMDYSGNPIYIGQTTFDRALICGQIYLHGKDLHFQFDGKCYTKYLYVKILCTQSLEDFVWVTVNPKKPYPGVYLVYGGFQRQYNLFIGRVFNKLETVVGKIYDSKLFTCTSSSSVYNQFSSFEALSYQP